MVANDSGISGGTAAGATSIAVICFVSLALYNVVELNFITFATFKRRGGLYFWSFLISTWGIGIYSVGFLLKDLQLDSINMLNLILIAVGWPAMVTGQSVVLYSRLHLLLRNRKLLRAVLYMIIFNAIICHIPILVMLFGANSPNPEPFITPYSIYEKVQVTIFFIQEIIISGLYIAETVKLVRLDAHFNGSSSRRFNTRAHLIAVNTIIVLLDITILALEYAGLYDIQTAYKALVYSVKLKLEFSILNRLVDITRARNESSYARSAAERDAVALRTVDGKPVPTAGIGTHARSAGRKSHGVGYRASVQASGWKGGEDGRAAPKSKHDNSAVFMTTEVIIRREERDLDLESHGDAGSGVTGASTLAGTRDDLRAVSSSSSQVELAGQRV